MDYDKLRIPGVKEFHTFRKKALMKKAMCIGLCSTLLGTAACKQTSQESGEAAAELIVQDTLSDATKPATYPIPDSFVLTDTMLCTRVLTGGAFHEEEGWEGMEGGTWYGVYDDKLGAFLEETSISATRVYDPIADPDEATKTGWEVVDSHPGSAILLISGIELENHVMNALTPGVREILPGDTVQFGMGIKSYSLFATGDVIPDSEYPELHWYENYRLFLAEKNGLTQQLVFHETFDDAMVQVLFVGDIDGDELPDLIIDTARHYNVSCPTLFLSSKASDDALLRIVGWHESTGC